MGNCGDSCKDHSHEHDHDGPDRGFEYSLFKHVDLPRVFCLNESVEDSGQYIFKPWDDRFEMTKFIESDADEQLIVHIPFTGSVKLKSIALFAEPGSDSNPSKMKIFLNRDDVDFDNVDSLEADQEIELMKIEDANLLPEYPTKMTKFFNVRNLNIYFPENFGAEKTRITYIGLKGEFTKLNKDPIITIYEAAANPADHKKSAAEEYNANVIQ